jgi:hypothetical protein
MTRNALSIVIVATLMVVCIVLALKTKRWMQIDSCLDGGGKWNYREHKCEGGTSNN